TSGFIGISVHSSEPSRRASSEAEIASCPSVKTSASTRTSSPTVRFAANLPQSTCGVMPSMMTRLRPSELFVVIAIYGLLTVSLAGVKRVSPWLANESFPGFGFVDQAFVQVHCLVGYRGPAENRLGAFPSGIPEFSTLRRVLKQLIQPGREILRELLWISWE